MKWIYLSPHLDDVALSCGGLVWEQTQSDVEVEVWTICAGDPPPGDLSLFAQFLHMRWEVVEEGAVGIRREEDMRSMGVLGARYRHLILPDAIYRRHPTTNDPLYPSWDEIINGIDPGDEGSLDYISSTIASAIVPDIQIVVPLTLGNHVDHVLTRAAAEQVGFPLYYYADYPYAETHEQEISALLLDGYRKEVYPISANGLEAWRVSVAAYQSQISSFWDDEAEMRIAISDYARRYGGVRLWQPEKNQNRR